MPGPQPLSTVGTSPTRKVVIPIAPIRIAGRALIFAITVAAVAFGAAAPASATMTGFRAVQGSQGWVDFNGDRKADICYLYSNADIPTCLVSTGTGFGVQYQASGADPGYSAGRAWADFNGDRKADYCRVIGGSYKMLDCTVSNGSGFASTYISAAVDAGYDEGRAWVDVNADGRADYCRVVGLWSYQISCTTSNGTGFANTFTSGSLDPGYNQGRSWVDVNGDNRADYCRIVGNGPMYLACTLSTGVGFGTTITSAALDPGYDDSRRWGDVNGDGNADYCRIVGSVNYAATNVQCTLSMGSSFGTTFTSGTMDAGTGGSGVWADFNGDGKDDYCRKNLGTYAGTCTVSNGTSFGLTYSAPVASLLTFGFADFNADGKADMCRWESGTYRCTVSTGTGFGPTYS
jgi:hypothetical protein